MNELKNERINRVKRTDEQKKKKKKVLSTELRFVIPRQFPVRIFPRARSSFPIVKLSTWEQSTKPVSRRWTSGAIACHLEIREKKEERGLEPRRIGDGSNDGKGSTRFSLHFSQIFPSVLPHLWTHLGDDPTTTVTVHASIQLDYLRRE